MSRNRLIEKRWVRMVMRCIIIGWIQRKSKKLRNEKLLKSYRDSLKKVYLRTKVIVKGFEVMIGIEIYK